MRAHELRHLSDAELQQMLDSLRGELFNLSFQLTTGQLQNTARIKQVKRDTARVLSVMQERRLGIHRKVKEDK